MLCKFISFVSLSLLLTGCAQMLPGLFSAVEDIETQEAITLTVGFLKPFICSLQNLLVLCGPNG
ncbi:MAG: hypothetical protein NT065_06465 [Chlamydiae bacterium]|nr:hypothetical protein [Chlamydiota bacterium]